MVLILLILIIVDPYSAVKSRADKEEITILSSNNITKTEESFEGHNLEVGKEDILLVIKNILYIFQKYKINFLLYRNAQKIDKKADICIIFIRPIQVNNII